jgi:hypothetical protein
MLRKEAAMSGWEWQMVMRNGVVLRTLIKELGMIPNLWFGYWRRHASHWDRQGKSGGNWSHLNMST